MSELESRDATARLGRDRDLRQARKWRGRGGREAPFALPRVPSSRHSSSAWKVAAAARFWAQRGRLSHAGCRTNELPWTEGRKSPAKEVSSLVVLRATRKRTWLVFEKWVLGEKEQEFTTTKSPAAAS